MVQYSAVSPNEFKIEVDVPQPRKEFRFRLVPFRSPLLRESRLLSIPLATKMFQFARLLPFSIMNLREGTMRLPYSGISESMFVLNSSELFAVAHALHHL